MTIFSNLKIWATANIFGKSEIFCLNMPAMDQTGHVWHCLQWTKTRILSKILDRANIKQKKKKRISLEMSKMIILSKIFDLARILSTKMTFPARTYQQWTKMTIWSKIVDKYLGICNLNNKFRFEILHFFYCKIT